MLRKSLAWLLTIMMVISMFPISVFATDDTGNTPNIEFIDSSFEEPANDADVNETSGESEGGESAFDFFIQYTSGITVKYADKDGATISECLEDVFGDNYSFLGEVACLTITLNANVTLEDTLAIPAGKTVTLDLAGHTISQTKEQTAGYQMILNDGNLTITDTSPEKTGKISYTDSGKGGEYISDTIYNRGTLVIEGGTIENLSSDTVAANGYPHAVDTYSGIRDTSVTINGGTIYCAEYSAIRMFCVSATYEADLVINNGAIIKGAVDMQNGTKDAALGSLTINGGTFKTTKNANNIRFANWNGGATEYGITASIKDGSFDGGISTQYVPAAANWNSKIISGGTFTSPTADVSDFVAEGYTLGTDGTVASDPAYGKVAKIGENYYATLAEALAAAKDGETVTLLSDVSMGEYPLNDGRKITLDLSGHKITSTDSALFELSNFSALTVKDTVGDGKVDGVTTGNTFMLYGNSNLVLENVDVYSNNNIVCVYGDNSTVTINGGNFAYGLNSGNILYLIYSKACEVTINGGVFNGNLLVYDFENFVVKGGKFTQDVSVYCAPGYIAQLKNEFYEIVELNENNAVAKIGEQYFASVNAALDYAYNNGMKDVEITLMGDTSASTTDIVDLYYGYNSGTAFNTITFKQAEPSKVYYLKDLYTGWPTDKFVFDGVNLVVTGQMILSGKVELVNMTTISSNAGITNWILQSDLTIEPGSKVISQVDRISSGSSLVVDGGRTNGEFNTSADYKTVWLYIEAGNAMTIKNGAYVIVSNYENAELDLSGTLNIQGSRLDVYTAIRLSGVLNIDANSKINTKAITGSGKIVINATGLNAGDTVAALEGVNLSGFTGTVELVNGGYLKAEIVDGKIKLVNTAAVEVIDQDGNKQGYATLEEAFAAAQVGDTIKLLQDVKLTGKLTLTKSITIDGNGYSIIADETAVWYTVSGKFNTKNYKTHLIGVNADGITLKNIVLDCNNNAAGINIYCAQNVVFDKVSVINATKGMAGITVNGSTLTVKTSLTVLGNSIAFDISNGSGVTSALGVTVEDGTVFNINNKTVKFASVAVVDFSGAVDANGNPYFAAKDNAYYYTLAQMESRTTAYSNGLTLLADVTVNREIEIKGTLNLNGHKLTVAEGKQFKTSGKLTIVGEGSLAGNIVLTSATATLTAPAGLNVTTTVDKYYVSYNQGVYTLIEVKLPEVTITDIRSELDAEAPDLTFALNFAIKDVDALTDEYLEKLFEIYGDYYVDYVLTISGLTSDKVVFNADGSDDGYLAGQYDAWSEYWLSVPFDSVELDVVNNSTSLRIMEYAAELMGKQGLRFTLYEVAEIVQNFNCGVYFAPEFLADNPNMVVTLELQVFTETDGVKTDVHQVAENEFLASDLKLPNAEVNNLGSINVTNGSDADETHFNGDYYIYDLINGTGLTTCTDPFDLTLAMQFIAKDTLEQAQLNYYANYTTDFFIQMTGMKNGTPIDATGCYIAGYYPSFGAWVVIPLDGFEIKNGAVYPVITSAGFDFKYVDICDAVENFVCGIYLTPEVLEANPDLEVTLTLGLSENVDRALAGKFVTVKSYEYDAEDLTPKKYVAQIGTTRFENLQDAIDAVENGQTITLLADVTENVTVVQTPDVAFTIDGDGKTMSGTITVDGKSAAYATAGLTIKNVNFKAASLDSEAFINLGEKGDNNTRYTSNVTIENCTFTYSGDGINESIVAIKNYTGGCKNLTVTGCTATGLHSLLQLKTSTDVTVNGCTVTNCKNGISVDGSTYVTISGNEIDVAGYGVRANGGADVTISSCKVKAFIPVVVRKATVDTEIKFTGTNAMTASNPDGYWMVAGETEYETNGTLPKATDKVTVTVNDTTLNRAGIYGAALNGKGTEENPFVIYTVNDLILFRDSVNAGETKYNATGVYVVLGANIDLTSIENWEPIGTFDYSFDGNFNGKGHKIMNLKMSDSTAESGYAYLGFFGVTANNTIENFVIENVTINSNGQIVAAAIAYPYYTTVNNITVCGDIAIKGGNYTAGVLAYTRLCVNARNLTVSGNEGSYITGAQAVGGVISDIQMNGGLTANYSNFSASGLTISGTKMVGGISGIIATQTLNGATVEDVKLVCTDTRVGVVAGCLGGTSTISNVTYENVTGATAIVGGAYNGGAATQAKIGDTYYATLDAALAAAEKNSADADKEVTLLVDYNATLVLVPAGVTLDLNGKTLDVSYFIAVNDSQVEDSTTSAGNLIAGYVTFAKDNAQMPIEVAEGTYKFAGVELGELDNQSNAQEDMTVLYIKPLLGSKDKEIINLFVDDTGMSKHGLEIIVRLTWTATDGSERVQDYKYTDKFVKDVYTTRGAGFGFRATGLSKYNDMTIQFIIVSETGVECGYNPIKVN